MSLLKQGEVLASDLTRNRYCVATGCTAKGGFGEVYEGYVLRAHRRRGRRVAIKASRDPSSWHGEAYFGRLLAGDGRVVSLLDAFPVVDGSGRTRRVRYILVLRWMKDGTVDEMFTRGKEPWPEHAVIEQLESLLEVLALLHRRGICHGDITPRNVFIDGGRLVLGDLGIANQALDEGPLRMLGAAPGVFAPPDAVPFYWSPSADVYQVGLLGLSLLTGEMVASYEVSGRALKSVTASDHVKGWLREAVSNEAARFGDASDALATLRMESVKPARAPRSLRNQRVVFTGILPVRRAVAQQRARAAGAAVQDHVNGRDHADRRRAAQPAPDRPACRHQAVRRAPAHPSWAAHRHHRATSVRSSAREGLTTSRWAYSRDVTTGDERASCAGSPGRGYVRATRFGLPCQETGNVRRTCSMPADDLFRTAAREAIHLLAVADAGDGVDDDKPASSSTRQSFERSWQGRASVRRGPTASLASCVGTVRARSTDVGPEPPVLRVAASLFRSSTAWCPGMSGS